jgi:hypothetical protein
LGDAEVILYSIGWRALILRIRTDAAALNPGLIFRISFDSSPHSTPRMKTISATIRCCLFALLTLFAATSGVQANSDVPNTFADPVIASLNNATGAIYGGSTISLRSALKAADTLGGTHTVTLSAGTYVLDGSASYTIAAGTLFIQSSIPKWHRLVHCFPLTFTL